MAVTADPAFPFISFPQSCVFSGVVSRKEEAAAEAGKPEHGDFRRTAASARNWTGDRGEDFADAQIVRRVQERGRFAGHPWHRQKAPRQNAQIFDGREARDTQEHAATGEAGSCCTQAARQAIREIPHIRRPTASRERSGNKKSACFVRNDAWGTPATRQRPRSVNAAGARNPRASLGRTSGEKARPDRCLAAPGMVEVDVVCWIIKFGGLAWAARCAGAPDRRCGCRSLRGQRLFSDDW